MSEPAGRRPAAADDGELSAWLHATAEALGVGAVATPGFADAVLDLTSDVAHGVARPAAPLAAYLVGAAVARGVALDDALRTVRDQLS